MGPSSEIQYDFHWFDKRHPQIFFSPCKEHVRLFRSLKFFRPLAVRSVRLLFVVAAAAAAYVMATCLLLGLPPEVLQYLQLISQTWASGEDSKQRNILYGTWSTWHLACLDDHKQMEHAVGQAADVMSRRFTRGIVTSCKLVEVCHNYEEPAASIFRAEEKSQVAFKFHFSLWVGTQADVMRNAGNKKNSLLPVVWCLHNCVGL